MKENEVAYILRCMREDIEQGGYTEELRFKVSVLGSFIRLNCPDCIIEKTDSEEWERFFWYLNHENLYDCYLKNRKVVK